jgi:hypothetical protein
MLRNYQLPVHTASVCCIAIASRRRGPLRVKYSHQRELRRPRRGSLLTLQELTALLRRQVLSALCQFETWITGAAAERDAGKQTCRIHTCMVRLNAMA